MLKTNSKAAKQNIKNYILTVFNEYATDCGSYPEKAAATLADAAAVIFKDACKYHKKNGYISQRDFEEYSAILPGYVNTHINAVDILAEILKETPAEKMNYEYGKAENVLTAIVYRELRNAYDKANA